jgi:hypothetical protein
VSEEALDHEDVDAAVEEVCDAGSAEVVRADRRNLRLLGQALEGVSHELIRQSPHDDATLASSAAALMRLAKAPLATNWGSLASHFVIHSDTL